MKSSHIGGLCIFASALCLLLSLFAVVGHGNLVAISGSVRGMGHVRQEEEQVVEFELRNEASVPVKILEVTNSCGCMGATLSSKNVAPKCTVVVRIDFSTKRAVGLNRLQTLVMYQFDGDPKQHGLRLSIEMYVDPDHDVHPARLVFGGDQPTTQEVLVSSRYVPKLSVDDVSCNRQCFRAQAQPLDDENTYKVSVEFSPSTYSPDAGPAVLQIRTNSDRQPIVEVDLDVRSQ